MKHPSAVVVLAIGLTACGSAPPSPSESAATTVLTFSRPADAFVGADARSYTRANAAFDASIRNDGAGVYLSATVTPAGGFRCQLSLAAPHGQPPAVGSYPATTRWPFQSPQVPGLDFDRGSGCNSSDGSFVIHALSSAQVGPVDSLDVTFEQTCHRFGFQGDERMATLAGQLRIVPGR